MIPPVETPHFRWIRRPRGGRTTLLGTGQVLLEPMDLWRGYFCSSIDLMEKRWIEDERARGRGGEGAGGSSPYSATWDISLREYMKHTPPVLALSSRRFPDTTPGGPFHGIGTSRPFRKYTSFEATRDSKVLGALARASLDPRTVLAGHRSICSCGAGRSLLRGS